MAKKNKVSVGAWERIAKEMNKDVQTTFDWHGEQLEIKHRLGLAEFVAFCEQVISDCFGDDYTEYKPEARTFAIERALIHFYTNLTLPVDIEKQYDLITMTGIADFVAEKIDRAQYGDMLHAIDERIEIMLEANAEAINAKLGQLGGMLDEAEKMFSEVNTHELSKLVSDLADAKVDQEALMKTYLEMTKGEAAEELKDGEEKNDGKVNVIELT